MKNPVDPIDRLRRASEDVNRAEAERNRLLRQLRSQRVPITKLSEAAGISVGSVHSRTKETVLVSIGYEGRSPDEFFGLLEEHGVAMLVDVRQQALSRKAGFAKRALMAACRARGIEYVHEPTLGNPRDNRDSFRNGEAASRSVYRAHVQDQGGEALARLARIVASRTTAVLCFEADSCSCHRSIVAEELRLADPLLQIVAV